MTDAALALGQLPSEQIRMMRSPSVPVDLFPSKAGKVHAWTVSEVLHLDRSTTLYRSWRSGMPPQATTLIDDGFSGSTRNSLEVM